MYIYIYIYIYIVFTLLIPLDMTPVRLEYSESNPREFTLQWDKVYVPSNFTVLSYSIEITDESNKVLDTVRVTAASQETYEYSYMSGQSRSDLPECSRRAFSVFAETDNGNTERVEVVWEQPKRKYCTSSEQEMVLLVGGLGLFCYFVYVCY